jgi:hypothetical protein
MQPPYRIVPLARRHLKYNGIYIYIYIRARAAARFTITTTTLHGLGLSSSQLLFLIVFSDSIGRHQPPIRAWLGRNKTHGETQRRRCRPHRAHAGAARHQCAQGEEGEDERPCVINVRNSIGPRFHTGEGFSSVTLLTDSYLWFCLTCRLCMCRVQAFVKVSMDGTPYLRKVDVAAYDDYGELVEALNEMFCCASIGKLFKQAAQQVHTMRTSLRYQRKK